MQLLLPPRVILAKAFLAHAFLAVAGFMMCFGCATSDRLSERPFQWIDRKAVETEGVTTYHLIYGRGLTEEAHPFIYPAYWRQGVRKRLTLVWMPLPLEIEWLIGESSESWHTLRFSFLGQVYARNKNFDWRPETTWTGRLRLAPALALEVAVLLRMEITRDPTGNPGNQQSLAVGPLFQISERFGVKPSLTLVRENGTMRARYVGAIPPGNEGVRSERERFYFPLGLESSYQVSKQLELNLILELQRLGYPAGFTGLPAFLSLRYSW